ncbi:uncharacterized protein K452DRAFT_314977 [Aplosporella prunicola CBS 121167]|uniref:ATP-dependent DNA helicase n=1 Tax=Aplosporella prunicola CBS 121167 TaxID=1176127 RepID=A0A6A6BRM8_9PEZI|nr:uncharacterized protein K452DRAFT_314977 [Aplosporella prunicola CBS 121167]KAF2146749.1 hypothetical protein K452DRAFT_314977 [Aplosporella prunicola CBS 121167]
MPPRKRIVTVPSSSDAEVPIPWSPSPEREPQPKPVAKRKRNTRKNAEDNDEGSPKKRKRVSRKTPVDQDEAAKKPKRNSRKRLDPNQEELDFLAEEKKKSKYRIHEPDRAAALDDMFLTQLPQDESPPWKIRGPVWQKQKSQSRPPPPPVFQKPPPKPSTKPSRPYYVEKSPSGPPVPSNQSFGSTSFSKPPPKPPATTAHLQEEPRSPAKPINGIARLPFLYSSPISPFKDEANSIVFNSSPPSPQVSVRSGTVSHNIILSPKNKSNDIEKDVFVDEAVPSSLPKRPKPVQDIPVVEIDDDDFDDSVMFTPPCAKPEQTKNPPVRGNAADKLVPNGVTDLIDDSFGDFLEDGIEDFLPSVALNHPANGWPTGDAPPLRNTPTYDVEKELADLPSDAFSSSMSSSSQNRLEDGAVDDRCISPQTDVVQSRPQALAAPLTGLRQTTLFGNAGAPIASSQVNKRHNWPLANREEPPTHHKLDLEAMKTWVYPTNLGIIRDYQYNIVHRGLFHNLLVALPTGLGKTFIAATIMLNWFRWTKDAQIVFVAPTRPLVEQQVEACLGIAGIPRRETVMLTGEVSPAIRAEEWASKRVFFMTPQTIINDLKTGYCDPKKIVLLVVDEAHRATGAYSYVEVVKFMRRFNNSFRVLALTATPGADVETVQKVIDNMEISKVEIRTENSLDIQPFIHKRSIETKVFRNNKDMLICMDLFTRAVQPVLDRLNQQNAYWARDPMKLSNYGVSQSRTKWFQSDAGRKASQPLKGMVVALFAALQGLCHGVDLLKYHSIRPFYQALIDYKNNASKKYQREISDSPHFEKLLSTLRERTANPDYMGHPKLECLRQVILNHFMDAGETGPPREGHDSHTRIMVFAQWRDSAEEICRVLKLNEPMVRPHVFVGQAATKKSEGMVQKRQKEVVEQFKTGVYNTLVATSIGEEGLDIGEVDLIVCYDQGASPIRMLQRMGRTGRKRQGKIVQLHMEGKEQTDSEKSWDSYKRMQEKIASGDEFNFHDDLARRIVPKEIQPVVDKRFIEIPIENTQLDSVEPKRRKAAKRPPKKFHMPDGVRTGFTSALRMGDDDDDAAEGRPRARTKAKKADPGNEPVPIVTLEEVTLSKKELSKLERLYQNILDTDDDKEITTPLLHKHPERQRRKGKTRYLAGHGRLTKAFICMVNRMHDVDEARVNEFRSNVHMSDIEDGASADDLSEAGMEDIEEEAEAFYETPAHSRFRVDMVGEGEESSPPPTDPRMRIRSQGITLGTSDTEGEDEMEDYRLDSELADFIVDDEEQTRAPSSSLPSIQYSSRKPSRLSKVQRVESDSDDDDELPDISSLVQRKKSPVGRETVVVDSDEAETTRRQQKRRRMVVSDSESE